MARFGLTLYLIVATLPGSWACCCAPARWLSSLSVRDKSPPARRTCCGGASRDGESKPTTAPRREQNRPKLPCSCERGKSPIVLAETGFGRIDLRPAQTGEIDLSADLSTAATSDFDESKVFHRSAHFPYLTAKGILRALSVMRC